jgi:hypothetical protein
MLSRYDLDHKGSNMNDDSEFSRGASVLALTRRRRGGANCYSSAATLTNFFFFRLSGSVSSTTTRLPALTQMSISPLTFALSGLILRFRPSPLAIGFPTQSFAWMFPSSCQSGFRLQRAQSGPLSHPPMDLAASMLSQHHSPSG